MKLFLGTATALAVLHTVDSLMFGQKYSRAFLTLARHIATSMGFHV